MRINAEWPPPNVIASEWDDVTDVEYVAGGGQKSVYRAMVNGEDAALKLVSVFHDEEEGPDPETVLAYWQREIRVLATCQADTLVRLVNWAPRTIVHDNQFYVAYAEQFIDGPSMAKMDLPMTPSQVVRLGLDICTALSALHEKGYQHRDIKPGNIIYDQRYVLVDPGIAFSAEEPKITETGCMPPGTSGFRSPEQCDYWSRYGNFDGRADLFSLGIVLAIGFTGYHPYQAIAGPHATGRSLQSAIISVEWDPSCCPDLPASTVPILSRLLRRHAHQRYRTAAQLSTALEGILGEV